MIEAETLRQILRRFAAGVTVITSVNEEGAPVGMTATAFSSVSIDPPMILICVDATARTRLAIERAGRFAVNVLADAQEDMSKRFASKDTDKFTGVAWHAGGATGMPVLDGALGAVECLVDQAVAAGTHIVYIGAVQAGSVGAGEPLIYYEGAYRRFR